MWCCVLVHQKKNTIVQPDMFQYRRLRLRIHGQQGIHQGPRQNEAANYVPYNLGQESKIQILHVITWCVKTQLSYTMWVEPPV